MKITMIILGVLCGLFGLAQGLQLIGLIGTKTASIPGVGLTILGLAGAAVCFKKAFKREEG